MHHGPGGGFGTFRIGARGFKYCQRKIGEALEVGTAVH
jgi:hypothetical protein